MNKKLRTWCYVMEPQAYEIRCDLCEGSNITWSEFCGEIWCYDCNIDTKGSGGIFDGPIPLEVAKMFGISFDRIDLKTGERLYMTLTKIGDKIMWRRKPPLGSK